MPAIVFRTLRREFRLHAATQEGADAFAFMATTPQILDCDLEPVDLHLEPLHGFWRVRLPDRTAPAGTAAHVLAALHGLTFHDTVASEPGAPMIHGATVVGDSGRLLLVATKASGKTTLALSLLDRGYAVEGDEHLVVGEEAVVARPRTMRVKAGGLTLVPRLAETIRRSPFVVNWDGTRIHAFDPSITGRPWRIARGSLHGLVFLQANHGGRSVMSRMAPEEAFRQLMSHVFLPPGGVPAAVGRLRALAMRTPAARLSLGDLEGAEWHLRHLRQLSPP